MEKNMFIREQEKKMGQKQSEREKNIVTKKKTPPKVKVSNFGANVPLGKC